MQTMAARQDQLRLISIVHYLSGGFLLLIVLFLACSIFSVPSNRTQVASLNLPLIALLSVIIVIVTVPGVLLVLSGYLISKHRLRLVSILAAILFFPFFPIGTVVTVVSLLWLTSPENKALYPD